MNNYTLKLYLTLFPNIYQSNQCKLNEPVVADTVTLCYIHNTVRWMMMEYVAFLSVHCNCILYVQYTVSYTV